MKSGTAPHDNPKINALQNQMKNAVNDFQDMIKAREEAKRQLEAKFNDVYSKIQSCKDYTISEGKKVADSLKEFQIKFDNRLSKLDHDMNTKLETVQKNTNDNFKSVNDRISNLEKMIQDEKAERLRQTDENLNPIKEKLKSLTENFDLEKSIRIEQKKELLQKIADEAQKLSETLNKEKTERTLKQNELKDTFKQDLALNKKFVDQFQKDMTEKNDKMRSSVEGEITQRFAHQDEIINNLSIFITKFQETLKVVGKDV